MKPTWQGLAMLIRYANDFIVAFQYRDEAREFYRMLPERLEKFGLDVAPEKTHLKRFTRFQPGKKRSFKFLGFEFYWSLDAGGESRLRKHTSSKKQSRAKSEFYRWIKHNRSKPLREFMPSLRRKLVGFRNYFGLPDNSRSQRRSYNWRSFKDMLGYFKIESMRVSKRNIFVDWY